MKSLMKAKKLGRFYDGGEVEAMGSNAMPEDGADLRRDDELLPAPKKVSAPVAKKAAPVAKNEGSPGGAYRGQRLQTVNVAAKSFKDDTSKSVADRVKTSLERSRAGSGPTDTRSVSERIRSAFGFADGGVVKRQTAKSHGKAC